MAGPRGSYDDIQLHAVLRACRGCRRAFYFTGPHPLCAECRHREVRPDVARRRQADVQGNPIDGP